MRESIVAIVGPTAVGKTKLSLTLAQDLDGEIVSADSMQIYKKMDIGTAKASPQEQKLVPHHMLDIVDPAQEFSVADFQERVDQLIPQISQRDKLPILVGGTGLYVKALIQGFLFPEMEKDWELRNRLEAEAKEKGTQFVHDKLKEIDPTLADKLHPNDIRRVIRGIEVYQQTGKTITHFKEEAKKRPPRYQAVKIGLKRDREKLYERINKRVDLMIEEGLVKEVRELYNQGYSRDLTSMQGLGYKELIGYFEDEYDLEEAVRLIKRNTRHFAKRQLTWFKRDDSIHWFDVGDYSFKELVTEVKQLIN
ncbi:tRNA isopentenyltransferase MiaA [Halobacteroides halobius DSM 5150]|uniref:tRNA dimethylallyltransferase n=1 Tax=Halobacteroides halobius (strain ATCC 35273 / DSM 5150 / MD-1) TaxID=748449 RepID=L0K9Z8_HALHC|nr:tRNA (adenosine(37)-N6)-dimethylallyltransferase MiaA [Halobacteroides halobius]AGB40928.1 tRNA isopentenyltransferase MiaA [Halobacteroides halobius DSM 5150]